METTEKQFLINWGKVSPVKKYPWWQKLYARYMRIKLVRKLKKTGIWGKIDNFYIDTGCYVKNDGKLYKNGKEIPQMYCAYPMSPEEQEQFNKRKEKILKKIKNYPGLIPSKRKGG